MFCDIALEGLGRRIGTLRLVHSDDRHAFGHVPIPVGVHCGGPGPTVLLCAGNHGDEYEGQAILLGLLHTLDAAVLKGRVIILPALNRPAVAATSRISPLDGANLNRAFLGGAPAGPTRTIAAWVEALLPQCALVVDLHSGGASAIYANAVLATRTENRALFAANMAAARACGLRFIQVLGGTSTGHSLNSAAAAAGVAMVAMELGGAARASRASTEAGRAAVMALLAHAGVLPGSDSGPPPPARAQRLVMVKGPQAAVVVPADGVLEPLVEPGEAVAKGEAVAVLHHWREPGREPMMLRAAVSGIVLAMAARGRLEPGDNAALIAEDTEEDL